ncbi:helix-turn-helix domain-containing protein [Kocuria palustris]
MAEPQFLTLADVADILAISASQARAMVRSGELPAIQIGGRGQWRVEKARFEQWIEKRHRETAEAVRAGASLD